MAILLVLQTALIVVLVVQNHRSRRAREDSMRQQSEVTHAARLALVGEITASIAHEVSQPLGAILSNADAAELLLGTDPPPMMEIRQILQDIRRDDLRANEIVRNLRRLLIKREVQMEPVDLNEIVSATLALTRADASRRGVRITRSLDERLPMISGDPVHLQQVLLNLIINAMDAMREIPAAERNLTLVTRTGHGRIAEVEVIDTGSGIEPAALPKLFDSFYTTKPEGMGLGLSIARAIVQMHGGNIRVENRDRGAAFRFTLPLAA